MAKLKVLKNMYSFFKLKKKAKKYKTTIVDILFGFIIF